MRYLGIWADIRQQIQKGFRRLLRPANFVTWRLVLFTNGMSTDAAGIFCKRNGVLVLQYILQVSLCIAKSSAFNCIAYLASVLKVYAKVSYLSFGS